MNLNRQDAARNGCKRAGIACTGFEPQNRCQHAFANLGQNMTVILSYSD
jgi:hypothetical protein